MKLKNKQYDYFLNAFSNSQQSPTNERGEGVKAVGKKGPPVPSAFIFPSLENNYNTVDVKERLRGF